MKKEKKKRKTYDKCSVCSFTWENCTCGTRDFNKIKESKLPEKYQKAIRLFAKLGITPEDLIKEAVDNKLHDILIEAEMEFKFAKKIDLDLLEAIRSEFGIHKDKKDRGGVR